jgi:hypothetical protein
VSIAGPGKTASKEEHQLAEVGGDEGLRRLTQAARLPHAPLGPWIIGNAGFSGSSKHGF